MFILMQSTVDQESSRGIDCDCGVVVDGEWDGEWVGQWRVRVKDGALWYEAAENLDGMAATFHYKDAWDFVLYTSGRIEVGDVTGDPRFWGAAITIPRAASR